MEYHDCKLRLSIIGWREMLRLLIICMTRTLLRAGMVAETGEATARFLRSVAEGEVDQREALNEQAALGLQRVRSVKDDQGGRPGKDSCRIASHELVRTRGPLLCMCIWGNASISPAEWTRGGHSAHLC